MDKIYQKQAPVREQSFVVVQKGDIPEEDTERQPTESVSTNFNFYAEQRDSATGNDSSKIQITDETEQDESLSDGSDFEVLEPNDIEDNCYSQETVPGIPKRGSGSSKPYKSNKIDVSDHDDPGIQETDTTTTESEVNNKVGAKDPIPQLDLNISSGLPSTFEPGNIGQSIPHKENSTVRSSPIQISDSVKQQKTENLYASQREKKSELEHDLDKRPTKQQTSDGSHTSQIKKKGDIKLIIDNRSTKQQKTDELQTIQMEKNCDIQHDLDKRSTEQPRTDDSHKSEMKRKRDKKNNTEPGIYKQSIEQRKTVESHSSHEEKLSALETNNDMQPTKQQNTDGSHTSELEKKCILESGMDKHPTKQQKTDESHTIQVEKRGDLEPDKDTQSTKQPNTDELHKSQVERNSDLDHDIKIQSTIGTIETQGRNNSVSETLPDSEKLRQPTERDKFPQDVIPNRNAPYGGRKKNVESNCKVQKLSNSTESFPEKDSADKRNIENKDLEHKKLCKSQTNINEDFGMIELIKIGKFWLISLNGKKSKLPKNINQDSTLRIEEPGGNPLLLTDDICYAVKVIENRIVLEECRPTQSASATDKVINMCSKQTNDTTQIQENTKKCKDVSHEETEEPKRDSSMIGSQCTGIDAKVLKLDETNDVSKFKTLQNDGQRINNTTEINITSKKSDDRQVTDDSYNVNPSLPGYGSHDIGKSLKENNIEKLKSPGSSANNDCEDKQKICASDVGEQNTDKDMYDSYKSHSVHPESLEVDENGRKVSGYVGVIELIKVGKFWLIAYNGKKSKLPKTFNQDGTLQLKVEKNTIFLLTGTVCYKIIPSAESISLEESSKHTSNSSLEDVGRGENKCAEMDKLHHTQETEPSLMEIVEIENGDGKIDSSLNHSNVPENIRDGLKCKSPTRLREEGSQYQSHDGEQASENNDRPSRAYVEKDPYESKYPSRLINDDASMVKSQSGNDKHGKVIDRGNGEGAHPEEDDELTKMFSSMQITDTNENIKHQTERGVPHTHSDRLSSSYARTSPDETVNTSLKTDDLLLNASKTTHSDEEIKIVCAVVYRMENMEQECITKQFHMTFQIEDYMRWMFFIKSPVQRTTLSCIDINQVKFEVSVCPDKVSILTPLKHGSPIQTIVQAIKKCILSLTQDVLVFDITDEADTSKVKLKESSIIENKECYMENISSRDLLACHSSQKQVAVRHLSFLPGGLEMQTSDSSTIKERFEIEVKLPLNFPWAEIFERFGTFEMIRSKFHSVQLKLMSEPTFYVKIYGPQRTVSEAKKFLEESFVNRITQREINLSLKKTDVFKETKLCQMINKELSKNVLVAWSDDRPVVFCQHDSGFKDAFVKIYTELVSEEEVQLTERCRDDDAISYLRITHCSEKEGVLFTVESNGTKIFVTGWKPHVTEITRNMTTEIKSATKQHFVVSDTEKKLTHTLRTLQLPIEDEQIYSLLKLHTNFIETLEKNYNASVSFDDQESFRGLLIRGRDDIVTMCKKDIDDFIGCITTQTIELDKDVELLSRDFQKTLDMICFKDPVLLDMKVQLKSGVCFLDQEEYKKVWKFPNGGKVVLLNADKTEVGSYYVVKVNEAITRKTGYTESTVDGKVVVEMEQPTFEKDPKPYRRTQEIIRKIIHKAEKENEEAIAFNIKRLNSWSFHDLLRSWLSAFEDFFMVGNKRSKLKYILLYCQTDDYKPCLQPFKEEMIPLSLDRMDVKQDSRRLKITVMKGKLDDISADVIVNTASPNLDLTKGAVSYAILRRAGPELQKEISQHYPKGITPGEIAVTKGHRLKCKSVYHGALQSFDPTRKDEISRGLRRFILKCLNEASVKNVRNIAFPAIGTGNLKYPIDFVVNHMFDTVKSFEENNPNTSLNEVYFVVFEKDLSACRAFERRAAEEKQFNSSRSLSQSDKNQPGGSTICITGHRDSVQSVMTMIRNEMAQNKIRLPVKEQTENIVKTKSYSEVLKSSAPPALPPRPTKPGDALKLGYIKNAFSCQTKEGLTVRVYQGDIFNLPVDGIVLPDRDADHKSTRSKVGKAFKTDASKTKYRCVIHAAGPCWHDYTPFAAEDVLACQEDLKRAIADAFTIANRACVSMIAVPAISSGNLAVPKELCAIQYVKAVTKFSSTMSPNLRILKEVHFVDVSKETVDLIDEAFVVMVQKQQPPPWHYQKYCRKEFISTDKNIHIQSKHATDQLNTPPYYIENKNAVNCKFTDTKMVTISYGDILEFNKADALVCSEDQTGQAVGAVAKLLLKKAGVRYSEDKQRHFKQTRPMTGDVIVTTGGNTGYKWIIHAIMPHKAHFGLDEPKWKQALSSMLDRIFETIEIRGYQSIVMSLLGTGGGGSEPVQCAKILIESFEKYCVTCRESFLYLSIVNNDRDRNATVMQLFKDHIRQIRKYSDVNQASYQDQENLVYPVGRVIGGKITGNQPNGTMTIDVRAFGLEGFKACKTISISYTFLNGKQGKNHPSPGKQYYGIHRQAYLPDNKDGREVCTLLKLAFERRLVFTIGTTRTGEQGVVTWNDIQHKTDSMPNARYGYPDSGYLERVKKELAAKGVTLSDPEFDKPFMDRFKTGSATSFPVTIRVPYIKRETSL